MRTHPVFLRLDGRLCVIVGGDDLAADKAAACLRAGAGVLVIAPEVVPPIAALASDGHLRRLARTYQSGDLTGAFLAYASTRDPDLIRRLADEAGSRRVLLNVIDLPAACTFISPAVVQRGDLQVAIGTGGASPGLARQLRRELERSLGPEYGPFVAILGAVRRELGGDPVRGDDRRDVLAALLASPLLDLVRERRHEEVNALLARVAGSGCTLERLGVALDVPGA